MLPWPQFWASFHIVLFHNTCALSWTCFGLPFWSIFGSLLGIVNLTFCASGVKAWNHGWVPPRSWGILRTKEDLVSSPIVPKWTSLFMAVEVAHMLFRALRETRAPIQTKFSSGGVCYGYILYESGLMKSWDFFPILQKLFAVQSFSSFGFILHELLLVFSLSHCSLFLWVLMLVTT